MVVGYLRAGSSSAPFPTDGTARVFRGQPQSSPIRVFTALDDMYDAAAHKDVDCPRGPPVPCRCFWRRG
jgi:hypothetical protein